MQVNLRLDDRIQWGGVVDIWDVPHIGAPRLLYRFKNVITKNGKKRALELISGESTNIVNVMALGDDGVVPGPPRLLDVPVAADETDFVMGNEVSRKTPVATVTVLNNIPRVTFTATFNTADSPLLFLNPSKPVINEAALLCDADELLFARRTFPSIPFDISDRLALILDWHVGAL